jgi:phthalate 4,5-dioxygenase oxygenase subunit
VVEFRRLMVEAARTMRDTGVALGRTAPHIPHAKISAFAGIVAKTTDWRTLGVAPEELALREGSERRAAAVAVATATSSQFRVSP